MYSESDITDEIAIIIMELLDDTQDLINDEIREMLPGITADEVYSLMVWWGYELCPKCNFWCPSDLFFESETFGDIICESCRDKERNDEDCW